MESDGQVTRGATGSGGVAARSKMPVVALQICLMVGLTVSLVVAKGLAHGDPVQELRLVSRVALAGLIAQVAVLRRGFGTLLSPVVLYALLMSLFTSGWLLLHGLTIEPVATDIISRLAPALVLDAATFYIYGFSFFALGLLVVGQPPEIKPVTPSPRHIRTEMLVRSMKSVGWLCVALGLVPFVMVTFNSLLIVVTQGYSAYYSDGARLDSPAAAFSNFFLPGIVMLGVASGRRGTARAVIALVLVGVVWLASGDRGGGLVVLLGALLLWIHTAPLQNRKPPRSWILLLYGAVAVVLIPFIGTYRHSAMDRNLDPASLLVEQNAAVETLYTLGMTLWPLAQTMALVPSSVDFTHGGSYASSLLRLIPDVLIPASWERLASDPLHASPGVWLMERLGMTYGPGFTPFAEAYLNFGVVGGFFALLVFGGLIALALRLRVGGSSPMRLAFVLSFFVLCGMSVRGSANFLVPMTLRFVVLPLVLVMVIVDARFRGVSRRSFTGGRRSTARLQGS